MENIDPILMTDEFWEGAFNPADPFREELLREFRRGVIHGGSSDLAWGRMAIYSLSDNALWPIVNRLLHFADADPSAEFVESLTFFLSTPEILGRVEALLDTVPPHCKQLAVKRTEALREKLGERKDTDLGHRLDSFVALLSAS